MPTPRDTSREIVGAPGAHTGDTVQRHAPRATDTDTDIDTATAFDTSVVRRDEEAHRHTCTRHEDGVDAGPRPGAHESRMTRVQ